MHFNHKSCVLDVAHRADHWFRIGAQKATERSWNIACCMLHQQQQVQRGGTKNVLRLSITMCKSGSCGDAGKERASTLRSVCNIGSGVGAAWRDKERSPSFNHHVQVWIMPGKNVLQCCDLHTTLEAEQAKECSFAILCSIQRSIVHDSVQHPMLGSC